MGVNGPLPYRTKFFFGLGQGAEGMKNGAMASLLLFYYNQVLGLPADWVGAALATALIVDAFTDPLAGSLSDRYKSRLGRRHPFMYASAIPLGVCFYFMFNPLVTGNLGLFIWLVVFTNLTRTAMTLYHVPHLALGAEMSNDFDERSSLVAFRQFFTTFGSFLTTTVGFTIFFVATAEYERGQLNPAAYAPFAATIGALMIVTIFASAWYTRDVIPYLPKPPADTLRRSLAGVILGVFADVRDALRAGSFRWLFGGVLIIYVMVGVDTALGLYMYTFFWELTGGEIIALTPAYALGLMAGAMLAPWFSSYFGKRAALMFGTASWAGFQILPVGLRLLGWFPENGDALLVPILFAMRVVQGAFTVQANVAFGSMVADVADEHELATGKRQEGVFFAASSFSVKCASGFGTFGATLGLMMIDWPEGPAVKSAADIPPETLVNLGILYGPVVAGCAVFSLWAYTHYKLTREQHQSILNELEARKRIAAA